MSDPFKVLGLEAGASEAEIKKAYKKLALEHHPDRHPDDPKAEERFKEISTAYETLKQNNWKHESPSFGGNYGFNGFSSVNLNIEDLFNQAFGTGGFGPFNRGRKVGKVRTGKIYITLEEAYRGCKKKLQINEPINCTTCKGMGYKLSEKRCTTCNGTGQQRTMHGVVYMSSTCAACKGFGREISAMCTECGGKGKKYLDQEIVLDVPAGTYHGAKINPTNDLQIQILYSPHKEFKLVPQSLDIASEREIDMFTAILGGTVSVNTLGGVKNVKIPTGCQPETILRIRQAGMKTQQRVGDHLLNVKVKLPKNLTEEQAQLLRELQQKLEENNGKS